MSVQARLQRLPEKLSKAVSKQCFNNRYKYTPGRYFQNFLFRFIMVSAKLGCGYALPSFANILSTRLNNQLQSRIPTQRVRKP